MTPKEQYGARKAERIKRRDDPHYDQRVKELAMEDLFDRFVTAVERVADALERKPLPMQTTRGWWSW